MENKHEIQPLLDLITEARQMVEANQSDAIIVLGEVRITAGELVEAAGHLSSPTPLPSFWDRFLATLTQGWDSVLKRLSLVSVLLFILALLVFTVYLSQRFNQPSLLNEPTPVGQTLRQGEAVLVENLLTSGQLNGTTTLIAQQLTGGVCPSTGFWRNNKKTFLLVCFTHSDYPGALKWVDGEYDDGGVFSVENLREFVNTHDLVLIHGSDQ